MDRIAPILDRADQLGPVNQDIDQKLLSDWICDDDEPLGSNAVATSKAQGEWPSLDAALAEAYGRLDQIDGRLALIQDSILKKSDVWIAVLTASVVVLALATCFLWMAL